MCVNIRLEILNHYFVYVPWIIHYTMQHPFLGLCYRKLLSVWNLSSFKGIISKSNYYIFTIAQYSGITLVQRSWDIPYAVFCSFRSPRLWAPCPVERGWLKRNKSHSKMPFCVDCLPKLGHIYTYKYKFMCVYITKIMLCWGYPHDALLLCVKPLVRSKTVQQLCGHIQQYCVPVSEPLQHLKLSCGCLRAAAWRHKTAMQDLLNQNHKSCSGCCVTVS